MFDDFEMREAISALVFCAPDYVSAWGGIELLRRRGQSVDLVAGSVTDSQMGEDYIETEMGVPAANARRNGLRMYELIQSRITATESCRASVRSGSPI